MAPRIGVVQNRMRKQSILVVQARNKEEQQGKERCKQRTVFLALACEAACVPVSDLHM